MKTLLGTLAAASLVLCGCASAGKNYDSRKVAEIVKGETTEAELRQMFGPPLSRGVNSESNTTLTWIYSEARVSACSPAGPAREAKCSRLPLMPTAR